MTLLQEGNFKEIFKTDEGNFVQNEGYSFMLRSPNQRANQIRRSYKNEEFDWLFDFVTVT